jgi:hypothetical protein
MQAMNPPHPPVAVPWDPAYETGHPDLDAQFHALLEICARLADHAPGAGLDEVLAMFKAQVRALFRAEDERLSGADDDLRDEQLAEQEEFEAFADEVVTTTHFDPMELQRFATVWSIGHLRSAAARLQGKIEGPSGD